MKLVIVESPAKAKTIGKYLSNLPEDVAGDFVVRASVGHVRDLPKSNKKAIDIESGFVPHYEIVRGKEKVIHELQPLVDEADEVILATDPDREGEAIAWHLMQALDLKPKKTKRIVFSEITKEAITHAMRHPRAIDEDLRKAQEARRVLDRLVGYDLSGLIWKKVRYGLSAGRVQSPALRILMEREREIRAFEPETYWVITADVETQGKEGFTLTCSTEPREKAEVEAILAAGRAHPWRIADNKEQQQKRAPRPPFSTSTLQQAASTRLNFSPSRTMQIAQRLYEAGHITYMRTDSTNLAQQALKQLATAVKKEFGSDAVATRTYATKSKTAQEAHEAIRPTNPNKKNAGTTPEQKKLYDLIWRRTVASQMIDAQVLKTKLTARIQDTETPEFVANGSRVLSEGWLTADPAARGEDVELPKVAVGDELTLVGLHEEEKQTQPPNRYTEAGLIKELEKRGIGRPSTYAQIMKTLNDRGYVEREGRTLYPTDTGDVVSSFLENNFGEYISDSFTAEMEDELDEIAAGERDYERTLRDFYTAFLKDLKAKEQIEKITNLGQAPEDCRCPKCGAGMIIKLGRGGKFMSCERFPECDGARLIDGKVLEPDTPIGEHPETGEDVYVLQGRYGPYVQVGEKTQQNKKPRRASVPKDKDPDEVSLDDALKYLSLPRVLGTHPETGEEIVAGIGRFGPFIVHQRDFRSLKEDSVYDVTLDRALEILAQPKQRRGGRKKAESAK